MYQRKLCLQNQCYETNQTTYIEILMNSAAPNLPFLIFSTRAPGQYQYQADRAYTLSIIPPTKARTIADNHWGGRVHFICNLYYYTFLLQ